MRFGFIIPNYQVNLSQSVLFYYYRSLWLIFTFIHEALCNPSFVTSKLISNCMVLGDENVNS